jgi:hypothetical protein
MTLLHPWWLLALPLWPLLLWFLRTQQQKRLVLAPDFLLWQRAAARLPQAASQARLAWKDLLWIAPPVLLTFGLAGPALRSAADAEPVALLVDGSASMQTKDRDGATRLDRGLREARRLIGSSPLAGETVARASLAESALLAHAAGRPVVVVTDRVIPDLPEAVGLVQVTDDARNAGIVSAGFDPATGFLVRVEGDEGAGARAMSVAVDGTNIENRPVLEASARFVLPPESFANASTVVVKIIPADAMAADDEVTLVRGNGPVRVSIGARGPASLEKALRAVPGAEVVRGGADGAVTVLVAPVSGEHGFETGPAAPREGAISGRSGFDGLTGPPRWKIYTVAKSPPGTETLLQVGAEPLLLRHEGTFVLLADPDENGWSSLPGFPLTAARIVGTASAGSATRLEPRPPFVLSPEGTRVARTGPPVSRPPALVPSAPEQKPLAPWAFAAAAAVMAVLGLSTRRTVKTR